MSKSPQSFKTTNAKKYYTTAEQGARRMSITRLPLTCTKCNAKFEKAAGDVSSIDREEFYRLTSPPPLFGVCPACTKAVEAAERVFLKARQVNCKRCGRSCMAELANTDNRTTIDRCMRCEPKERQPQEGDTFRPLSRIVDRSSGKFTGFSKRKRQIDDQLDYHDTNAARNAVKKSIYSADFIPQAQSEIERQSVRELARKLQQSWSISYETVRQGTISVRQLSVKDLQAPPERVVEHKPPRKCAHGNRMAPNDRRGRSRYCSACYPNRFSPEWSDKGSDSEVTALYEAGATISAISERLRLGDKSVRAALTRCDVELRKEDRLQVRKKWIRQSPKQKIGRRLAASDQSEEFGPIPLDPGNASQ